MCDVNNRVIRVFLGGTCNGSTWREYVSGQLNLNIEAYNPVVDDWNEAAQEEELRQRRDCDYCLYVITPRMKGVYSIAEAVDDSNKRPDKTLFCFINYDGCMDFSLPQIKSLRQVEAMIRRNKGRVFDNLDGVIRFLNTLDQGGE